MSKLLYIKANIKSEGESRTFRVSDSFIEEYKKNNPKDEVIVLDLYKENIDFLRSEDLGKILGPKDEESKNNPILKYAYQFAEADKYVIASPMWNLSIPAILKAYIDYVGVTGITFKYTAEGPVGLLKDKKAVHIVSRGGEYANAPYEMGDRYLRTILGFFGISEIETIAVENVDVIGVNVQEKVEEGIKKANLLAQKF
ncbi:putative FMN-dependent NADH-azoreductase AzoR [Clostridium neonatale]|uniref:NAD(P)H-dependent oxidoreductase n=1 Tax=Clostridium neonatale TaxID=137838 RepID=UPI00291C4A6D|nr:putative FMN-dependent NADH-azoreductase AzoR [Clostridium neonatale]CAI3586458.1 putative FMN-dependent NADH-azoreductase AzoR [Clostridium neonatale]CAI3587963.1 putative FMN-dependent NADH-azoreductase AzoR [Clostridium neonatale]CAI3593932.1 putative FMN-dependent NADH-azoreductase AzoR [Clostridium neonatale]CAI3657309.1 putative FMN-dependent NADH-azoreductase AzoR [Clostridium neonatale]